jgi:protein-tyrosine phosphatase
MKKAKKRKAPKLAEQYVVGRRDGRFCWLVPKIPGETADDQNLEAAQRFSSLPEAIGVSTAQTANVFELVTDDDAKEVLNEIMVDLDRINSVPFESCYWLMDKLLVGPNPICLHPHATEQRISGLKRAGVRCVVSLLSRTELFWSGEEENELWLESFHHHMFPVVDASVPTRAMMALILDVIDESIKRDHTTFVHCFSARGRSGLVSACLAARHGVATGESVLNFLAKRRMEYGLFQPSPETERQRQFARGWKSGQ